MENEIDIEDHQILESWGFIREESTDEEEEDRCYWYTKKIELPIFHEFLVIYAPADGILSFDFKVFENDEYTHVKYDLEFGDDIFMLEAILAGAKIIKVYDTDDLV